MSIYKNRYYVMSLISKIREHSVDFIEKGLARIGVEDLVVSHGAILSALYRNNGQLTMNQISEEIDRSKSTVTQLVDRLIEEGYVEKKVSEEDRRYRYIILTDKSMEIKEDVYKISDHLIDIVYKGFSELEEEMFFKMLLKVKDNFEQIEE
ncbi:MAG: MarR family winged helix-turn-helix transcriptional regulator [Halanaerobiales bacterium]